jgi:hypothetical protein
VRRITINPHRNDAEIRQYSQVINTVEQYRIDFSLVCTERSTTVSSVAWESEGDTTTNFANEALASNIATADISSTQAGSGMIKVTATLADGAKQVQYIELNVKNPESLRYA